MIARRSLLVPVLVVPALLFAQEHPFLSSFTLSEEVGAVRLDWTMVAGNTCTNTVILRGTDPLSLAPVGSILGICGSITEPVSFQWIDRSPPELSTLYYRLQLGTNGSSSIQHIGFDQLLSGSVRVFPSPATDEVHVVLHRDVPSPALIRVFDADGRMLMQVAVSAHGSASIDVRSLRPGAYCIQVLAGAERHIARFVVT